MEGLQRHFQADGHLETPIACDQAAFQNDPQ